MGLRVWKAATVDQPRAVIAYADGLMRGVEPVDSSSTDSRSWLFAETPTGPRAIVRQDYAVEVIRSGNLRQIMVSDAQTNSDIGNTALFYMAGSAP